MKNICSFLFMDIKLRPHYCNVFITTLQIPAAINENNLPSVDHRF